MNLPARFREWAPKLTARLMADFGLTDFQAAAVVGNAGAESGGMTKMQELNPTVKGSRGGYGAFQWTGPRRREFEAWLSRMGGTVHDFEPTYAFLYRELTGPEKRTIPALKACKTLDTATTAFCRVFERAGIEHMGSRKRWALEALRLYHERRLQGGPNGPAVAHAEAEDARATATGIKAIAAGAGATGAAGATATAGGTASLDVSSFDWTAWLMAGALFLTILIGTLFLVRHFLRLARDQRERADMFERIAADLHAGTLEPTP